MRTKPLHKLESQGVIRGYKTYIEFQEIFFIDVKWFNEAI